MAGAKLHDDFVLALNRVKYGAVAEDTLAI